MRNTFASHHTSIDNCGHAWQVLSTQPNAKISIESLADGRDFSLALNRCHH